MSAAAPGLCVVMPVRNEVGNVGPVLGELETALARSGPYEVIVIDDGSTDGTGAEIERLQADRVWLRRITHSTSCGKSVAVRAGVKAARATIVATMDGDGQNDPAAIPLLVAKLAEAGPACGLVAGQRPRRNDTAFKRFQSRAANRIRAMLLRDGTRDTNCGLKCFPRQVYLDLPFFDGLHRFMPALVKRDGFSIAMVDVEDRARLSGVSNYGFFDRLWIGIADLFGVYWLIRRRTRLPVTNEVSDR